MFQQLICPIYPNIFTHIHFKGQFAYIAVQAVNFVV